MKLMYSWYLSELMFPLFTLFFGFIGIHTGLSVYYEVPTPVETEYNFTFVAGVATLSWFMVVIALPVLHKIHRTQDNKYKEKVKIYVDDLEIQYYKNMAVAVVNDFAYKLPYSNVAGHDLDRLGYLPFTNYYNKDKKFTRSYLDITHIKINNAG